MSTRTVKRDISALQHAGVPIWASSGPGGGYVLDASATLPPVNLTPAQAVAVAVALAGPADAPFAADGRAALAKVLDVLGPAARAEAERLGGRVWMRGRPGGRPDPAPVVEEALAKRRVVAITYRDRRGVASRRQVEPHLLARTGDRWYLVGWCRERDAPRWFRWDRIGAADLTLEAAPERDPADFGTRPRTPMLSGEVLERPPPGSHPERAKGGEEGVLHSHSMVPGGLLVMSRTTRLTSATSLVMRVEIRASTS